MFGRGRKERKKERMGGRGDAVISTNQKKKEKKNENPFL
jgi:hypothetical protein